MKVAQLWDDPQTSDLYWQATIEWSKPRVWLKDEDFEVPQSCQGRPGLYRFIQSHQKMSERGRTVYIGKASRLEGRLRKYHFRRPRYGKVKVSCGLIDFHGRHYKAEHLGQIEDIIKFYIWDYLRNEKGFLSLPGFRANQRHAYRGWAITNSGSRGELPRMLCYPAFAHE